MAERKSYSTHDPIERLRSEIDRLQAENERLRKAMTDFLNGDYPHPRQHRPDGCEHGRPYWEECSECNEAHFKAALKGGERGGEADAFREKFQAVHGFIPEV